MKQFLFIGLFWLVSLTSFSQSHYIDIQYNNLEAAQAVDLDNDGYKDLLFSSGDIAYRKNLSGNGFGPLTSLYIRADNKLVTTSRRTNIGDFNNDGKTDLFVKARFDSETSGYYVGIVVLLNKENMDFEILYLPKVTTLQSTYVEWINDYTNQYALDAIEDIDRDGTSDAILGLDHTSSQKLNVYKYNNGNIKLSSVSKNAYPFGSLFSVGDMDADGYNDVIFKSSYAYNHAVTYYYKNLSDTSFNATPVTIQDAGTVMFDGDDNDKIYTTDVNGDGKFDLLSTVIFSQETTDPVHIAYKRNLGAGTFADYQSLVKLNSNERLYALKDVNGDGKTDIITYRNKLFNTDKDSLLYYKNLGNGVYESSFTLIKVPLLYAGVTESYSICYDNFDNNGALDLVIFSQDSLRYLKNSANITFKEKLSFNTTSNISGENSDILFKEDLDNDGDIDIVCVSSYPVSYLANNTVNFRGIAYVYKNDGIGNFTKNQFWLIDSLNESYIPKIFDYNSDGYKDICLFSLAKGNIYIYLNSTGSFSSYSTQSGYYFQNVYFDMADLNNDNKMDMLVVEQKNIPSLGIRYITFIHKYNTVSQLYDRVDIDTSTYAAAQPLISDLNNDNKLDIVLKSLVYFKNLGSFNFSKKQLPTPVVFDSRHYITSFEAFDVNNNGLKDIVAVYYDYDSYEKLYVLENNNSDSFKLVFSANLPELGYNQFNLSRYFSLKNHIDINNDGFLDIIFNYAHEDNYAYAINNGQGVYSFAPYKIRTFNRMTNSAVVAKIDNDNKVDIVEMADYRYLLSIKWGALNYYDTTSTTATVDLNVNSISLNNDTLFIGDTIKVTNQLRNLGNSTSAYTFKIYLSKDTTVNAGDVLLHTSTGNLLPNFPIILQNNKVIPVFDTGWIYCLTSIDTLSNELNKKNNKLYSRFYLKKQTVTSSLINSTKAIQIYPNPFTDKFEISASNYRIKEAILFSTQGRKMKLLRESENIFRCEDCATGTYLLKVQYSENVTESILLIKVK